MDCGSAVQVGRPQREVSTLPKTKPEKSHKVHVVFGIPNVAARMYDAQTGLDIH